MKLLFIIVLLVWMVKVFFGCQVENDNMNEMYSPKIATYAEEISPMLTTAK